MFLSYSSNKLQLQCTRDNKAGVCVCVCVVLRHAYDMQLELSNDCPPETEYQRVLGHPRTAVLDGGAVAHSTLLPYTADIADGGGVGEFLQPNNDWFPLKYGSPCWGMAALRRGSPPPPPRSPAICDRGRAASVTSSCGLEAHPAAPSCPLPPFSGAAAAPSSSNVVPAVTSTPTIKTARHNSLTSSFSNLI